MRGGLWLADVGASSNPGACMSSLIVLLPSSDVSRPEGWEAEPLAFALFGRKSEVPEIGQALLEALPQVDATVLVVAARDTLLLNAKLPPVTGPRLRRILPGVVEEYLIQDSQACHIAIDPMPLDSDERCLAVLDREWFASVIERFAQAGHRRLRAVPLVHCIPIPEVPAREQEDLALDEDDTASVGGVLSEPAASVLIVRSGAQIEAVSTDHGSGWVELAFRQGVLGFGMSVNAAQLDATLAELAQRQPLIVYSLDRAIGERTDVVHGVEHGAIPAAVVGVGAATGADAMPLAGTGPAWIERSISLTTVAAEALVCRFDLCQFEFANTGRNRLGAGGLRPWRVALGFVGASLLVSIIALNVQWFALRDRRDALNEQMTVLLKTAFPDTRVVLDPHAQMASELARLGDRMAELHANDYLALAASVAHALGPIASTSIAELNYSGGALDITFKQGADIDEDGLKRRFAANSLSAQEDNGKWTLKPAQSRPH
jgi:general secretion pathway protein L